MLKLADSWVWDSWLAFDGKLHHIFYLKASRGLLNSARRHWHAYIGHATSTDLVTWKVHPDVLAMSDSPAWDSWTTWTGSVVKDSEGTWWMFYTGTSREEDGKVQRIGAATSKDLFVWQKVKGNPLVEVSPEWYETIGSGLWHDQAWRDPWVFWAGDMWHMFVTARANDGERLGRGVVGHASSLNLLNWTVRPPLSSTDSGFGNMEVLQTVEMDGLHFLLWCCGPQDLSDGLRTKYPTGGMFSVVGKSSTGPFNPAKAVWFPHQTLYAAHVVKHDDNWYMIGFIGGADGENFGGYISDPIPITHNGQGIIPAVRSRKR